MSLKNKNDIYAIYNLYLFVNIVQKSMPLLFAQQSTISNKNVVLHNYSVSILF